MFEIIRLLRIPYSLIDWDFLTSHFLFIIFHYLQRIFSLIYEWKYFRLITTLGRDHVIQVGKDTDTEIITFYLIFPQIYIFYFQHLLFNLHKQLCQGPEEAGLARNRSLVTLTMLSHSLHLPDPIQIFQADVLYFYRQICDISWTKVGWIRGFCKPYTLLILLK